MKTLLAQVSQDTALQARFKACKSVADQVKIANELGFKVTDTEFQDATKLSDDQLDEVAGGGCHLHLSAIL